MIDIDALEAHFKLFSYKWTIGGEEVIPSRNDISETIDTAVEKLLNEEEAMLEVGRLVIIKHDGNVDVYAHFGGIND